ncbi:MAG: branched-chain amino acid transport system permease protein [Acidobacteriota bacterium]|jgi:branched-chain amino acid transport system permease protein|nr:branched-chain amino acid transport system permease protein [Acidobacteriota bacterium]
MDTFVQQLINGLNVGAIYALIALGYTMVYGILRLINFAHGDIYMVGAFAGYGLAYFIAAKLGLAGPSWAGLLIVLVGAMIVAALVGMAVERFAYRPVRKYSRMTTLITAIGVSLLIENLFVARYGGQGRGFPQLLQDDTYRLFGNAAISKSQILIFVVSIALMLLLQWIIYKTKVGTAMRAVSFNLNSAKLMGINTNLIITFTFALGSALAAAAGVLTAQYSPTIDPLMGITTGLKAFVAAVLGGIGNIPGAVLGGLLIGVAETMVVGYGANVGIASTYRDAVAFAILILVLLLRPSGLLGSTVQEKV